MKHNKSDLFELAQEIRESKKDQRKQLFIAFMNSFPSMPARCSSNGFTHITVWCSEQIKIDLWTTTIKAFFVVNGVRTMYSDAFQILNLINELYGDNDES